MRSSAKYRPTKFLTFLKTTALQHCLNHSVALRLAARRPWRGIAPPMTVSLFCGFRSFHCRSSV